MRVGGDVSFSGIRKMLSIEKVRRLLGDPFYSNSFYVMMGNLFAAGFGLLFWVIAARQYSKEDVGLATALISMSSLILLASRLGIDQSMARFLPKGDRSTIYSTTNTITTLASLALSVAFVLTASFWVPNLEMNLEVALLFLFLIIFQSIATTSSMAFVAIRKAKVSMIQNIVMGSRIIFLFLLAALGHVGVISAFTMSFLVAVIFGQIALHNIGIRMKRIDWQFLRMSMKFSVGNWISSFFSNLPALILPTIILGLLGPEQTADYYMAYSFAAIAFIFPKSFANQMYVDGCHGANITTIVRRTLKTSILVALPVVIGLIAIGPMLLDVLGKDYAENGLTLLRLLTLSTLFLTVYQVSYYVKLIQKDVKGLIRLAAVNSCLILGLSSVFMTMYGAEAIGYAWILSYAISSLGILGKVIFDRDSRSVLR